MLIKFWLGSVKIIRCLGSKFRGVELIRMMKIWFLAKYFQSKRGDVIMTTAPLLNFFSLREQNYDSSKNQEKWNF